MYLDFNENLTDVSEAENVRNLRVKESGPQVVELTKKEIKLLDAWRDTSDEELNALIEEGHNRHFVGRVGSFCPIKSGNGGAVLCREQNDNYYAVTGTKGYRWLEAEMVKQLGKENDIDRSYYDELVNNAIETISEYGDFNWFVSDDPYDAPPFSGGRMYQNEK